MAESTSTFVSTRDCGIFRVSLAGWYACDSHHRAVDGPFTSHAECIAAIRSAAKADIRDA